MGTRLNRLNEAIRTSTHNLYFRVEIRKFRIPLQTPFLPYNSGALGGKNITLACFPDGSGRAERAFVSSRIINAAN